MQFPHSLTIYRKAVSADGIGGFTNTWNAIGTFGVDVRRSKAAILLGISLAIPPVPDSNSIEADRRQVNGIYARLEDLGPRVVSCNMRQLNAEEKIINDKMSIEATHRVYCSEIGISVSDQMYITKYGSTASDLYDVKSLDKRRELGTGRIHHLEIDVKVIK